MKAQFFFVFEKKFFFVNYFLNFENISSSTPEKYQGIFAYYLGWRGGLPPQLFHGKKHVNVYAKSGCFPLEIPCKFRVKSPENQHGNLRLFGWKIWDNSGGKFGIIWQGIGAEIWRSCARVRRCI